MGSYGDPPYPQKTNGTSRTVSFLLQYSYEMLSALVSLSQAQTNNSFLRELLGLDEFHELSCLARPLLEYFERTVFAKGQETWQRYRYEFIFITLLSQNNRELAIEALRLRHSPDGSDSRREVSVAKNTDPAPALFPIGRISRLPRLLNTDTEVASSTSTSYGNKKGPMALWLGGSVV